MILSLQFWRWKCPRRINDHLEDKVFKLTSNICTSLLLCLAISHQHSLGLSTSWRTKRNNCFKTYLMQYQLLKKFKVHLALIWLDLNSTFIISCYTFLALLVLKNKKTLFSDQLVIFYLTVNLFVSLLSAHCLFHCFFLVSCTNTVSSILVPYFLRHAAYFCFTCIRGLRSHPFFKDKTRQDWRALPELPRPWQDYLWGSGQSWMLGTGSFCEKIWNPKNETGNPDL